MRRRMLRIAVAASCLLMFGGCSGGDGDDTDDDDGGGAVSKRIGPEGGTLETRGMRLEVPQGALASEVELTVSTSSETPRGYDAVSSVYRFGPPGQAFQKPARVQWSTDAGADAEGLAVYWSTDTGSSGGEVAYEPLPTTVVEGGVRAEIDSLGRGFVGTIETGQSPDATTDAMSSPDTSRDTGTDTGGSDTGGKDGGSESARGAQLREFPGAEFDSGKQDGVSDLAVDGSGNVYVVGFTKSDVVPSNGYVVSFDSEGKQRWLTGPEKDSPRADDKAVVHTAAVWHSSDKALYVAGNTRYPLKEQMPPDARGPFVSKYRADGSHQWTRKLSQQTLALVHALDVVPEGGVVAVGESEREFAGTSNPNERESGFLVELAADGSREQVHRWGPGMKTIARDVAVGAEGIHVAGEFMPEGSGGREPEGIVVTAFDRKYGQQWTRRYMPPHGMRRDHNEVGGVDVNDEGKVYLSGTYWSKDQPTDKDVDPFVVAYDATGTELWETSFGRDDTDEVGDLEVGPEGGVMVGGTFDTISDDKYTPFVYAFEASGERRRSGISARTGTNLRGVVPIGGNQVLVASLDERGPVDRLAGRKAVVERIELSK